jgi:hypothetical protein
LSLALIVLATAVMGWTHSVVLWLLLRFVAGLASAWALVSTSVWCLAWFARLRRPAGAGLLYAGVGVGIALAGLYCWHAGATGVAPERLWIELGALSLGGLLVVAALVPRDAAASPAPGAATPGASATGGLPWGLVWSYGSLGFGYILPATFLPLLARAVVDDPSVFGAAWPVFGAAAALSTVVAATALGHLSRRHVLAGSHVLMALGCVLPLLHLSAATVLVAALLVGGTFMVASMAGMQEAGSLGAGDPARALGRMTAAFAMGQMAGPMLSSALGGGAQGFGGLFAALAVGAVALLCSAAWLVREPARIPASGMA